MNYPIVIPAKAGIQEHEPLPNWRGLCSWIPGSPLRDTSE
jgi:hypothetical protein